MSFALLLALLTQDPTSPSPPQDESAALQDVLVVRTPSAPELDPFAFFETLCFDANRLEGRSLTPDDDPRWVALEDRERDRLRITDGAVITRMLESERVTLILKIESRAEGPLRRHVCTLTIAGVHDQEGLSQRMAGLFRGPGTRDHLDDRDHYPTRPGWTQIAWAAIPNRGAADWRVFNPDRRADSGFVVVTEPSFYRRARYVVGELNFTAAGERPVSVISLTHLFKPD